MTTNPPTTDLRPADEQVHRPPPSHKPQAKPKARGIIWVLLFIIVIGVTGYAVWRASQPGFIPPANQGPGGGGRGGRGRGGFGGDALPVVTAKAKLASVPVYLDGLGNVTAFYTVTVKSRVDGQLMKVNFQEGDLVKEGQVLAEIDPRPYQVSWNWRKVRWRMIRPCWTTRKWIWSAITVLVTQDAIPKQQLDTQKALVAQYEGNIKQDSPTSTTPSCSWFTPRSPRRSPVWSGCAWSIPAISSTLAMRTA